MCTERDAKSTDEIEITDAMIKAGVTALLECDPRIEGPEQIVEAVWEAMRDASMRRTPSK